MNVKNIVTILLSLLILSFFYQEIKLYADKRLEAYKVCVNNPMWGTDRFDRLKDSVKLCNEL